MTEKLAALNRKTADTAGEAASDVLIALVIAVCVAGAVAAVLSASLPGLAETLCLRIEELFSG